MNVSNSKVLMSFPLAFGTSGLRRRWLFSRNNIIIVNKFLDGHILGYEVS